MKDIKQLLKASLTPYHAVAQAAEMLKNAGFTELFEHERWQVKKGGRYFTVRGGKALVAFRTDGEIYAYSIAAAHADSPCLKIKYNAETPSAGCMRLATEGYGGGLRYTFLDRPLAIAGMVAAETDGRIEYKTVTLDERFVIPSLAIHFNRKANEGVKFDPQTEMQVLSALGGEAAFMNAVRNKAGGRVIDYDLYAVPADEPCPIGFGGGLILSPRADDLTDVFASVRAITQAAPAAVPVVFIADNEEVGSRTRVGAGSAFLKDVINRINACLGKDAEDLNVALSRSFMLSADNAHAVHPNFAAFSDPNVPTLLGGGVVIKHHGNMNYTTDAAASAVIRTVFERAGVATQDFFMRSDLPCGGTLGAISSAQLSVRSADVGIPQLAMHSAAETFAESDYEQLVKGITAFFSSPLTAEI